MLLSSYTYLLPIPIFLAGKPRTQQITRCWFQILLLFSPLPGEMIQFVEHISQMGMAKNHQLDQKMDHQPALTVISTEDIIMNKLEAQSFSSCQGESMGRRFTPPPRMRIPRHHQDDMTFFLVGNPYIYIRMINTPLFPDVKIWVGTK